VTDDAGKVPEVAAEVVEGAPSGGNSGEAAEAVDVSSTRSGESGGWRGMPKGKVTVELKARPKKRVAESEVEGPKAKKVAEGARYGAWSSIKVKT
jgi:hypothetical protein